MNIIRCSIISRRRADGRRVVLRAAFAEKERNNSKKEKKHHMPDVCRAYDAYEAYEVWKGLFLTPSTAAGGPPPSRREVWGRGNREFAECRRARDARTPSTAAAVPLPRGGRYGEGEIESLQNVGGRAMRAPTTLRKTATVRFVCNAGLHHCNG